MYVQPNFFIVGAPKAGTDQLYYDLAQHPDIYMSPLKEPNFFASEIRLEHFEPVLRPRMARETDRLSEYLSGDMHEQRSGGIVSEWQDYQRLFSGVSHETAVGECSVAYLWSNSAAEAIASRIPYARIVIILMDPAERAFAQYLKSISDGSVSHSFREHLHICFQHRSDALGVFHPFLEFGMYSEQVNRYLQAFPHQQVSISIYEEMALDRAAWFADMLKFLGIDSSFTPQRVAGHCPPNVPKLVRISQALQRSGIWTKLGSCVPAKLRPAMKRLTYRDTAHIVMQPSDRVLLADYYREDVLRLQDLLRRRLDHWLQ